MVQSESDCRICGIPIAPERLERWPWCVTCGPTCADKNAADLGRQARRRYRRRRRHRAAAARAAGGRQQQKGEDGNAT